VVQPADVLKMMDGEAGEAEGNNLVDRPSEAVHPDVGETVGDVSPKLAPETVLRRQDEVGLMAAFAEGPYGAAGDREMPALNEGDVRGDDQDPF
jgi:hypothetical protein